jgi:hypothetical protein
MDPVVDVDKDLDRAVEAAVASDVDQPQVMGWLVAAVHLLPSGETAIWYATGDLSERQAVALAESLTEELGG